MKTKHTNHGTRRRPFTLSEWVVYSKKKAYKAWFLKWCKVADKVYQDRRK